MWFLPSPKKPTPSEYGVLFAFVALALIVLGVVALVAGFRAPPEKPELAIALAQHGAWCLGIGVAIVFGFWLFDRLVD